jgi:hypothetical protein
MKSAGKAEIIISVIATLTLIGLALASLIPDVPQDRGDRAGDPPPAAVAHLPG